LRSRGGALVVDERAAPDHGYRATLKVEAFTIGDGFSKNKVMPSARLMVRSLRGQTSI
jgi:hypothetical protein